MTNHAYSYNQVPNQQLPQRLRTIEFTGEEDFKIKAYTKSELADMYGVHVNTLSKWINRHLPAFMEFGYTKALKMFYPCIVRLFISIFSTS